MPAMSTAGRPERKNQLMRRRIRAIILPFDGQMLTLLFMIAGRRTQGIIPE
jgi:hypothetical protein